MFLGLVRSGSLKTSACKAVGITYQTFFLWMRNGKEEKNLPVEQRTIYYDFYVAFLEVEKYKKIQKRNHAKKVRPKKQRKSVNRSYNVPRHYVITFDVGALTPDTVFTLTVLKNPFIAGNIFPTDKQVKFLKMGNIAVITPNKKTEVFFSGAGWSGKTSALLLAALQYVVVPGYQALLLRANPSSRLLSDRMEKIIGPFFERIKVIPEKEFNIWKFPSGSTITFGYVDEQFDKSNYDDRLFHFIGFDDLTNFNQSDYLYLSDRLHVSPSNKIPLRIFSTGNPDGTYRSWVKERFIDCSENEMKRLTRFLLQASIEDNMYVNRKEIEKQVKGLTLKRRDRIINEDWNI